MNTKPVPHPSFFIDTQLTDTIRHFAPEAERLGRLHPQQLSIIYDEKWFNLFVPKDFGGLQLTLPEGLRIEESLAWADGSTGWTITLCSGANWFIGFLPPETAADIFTNNKVCLAGSGRASGTARIVDDEFVVSGYWHYATGAAHATVFTANCLIEQDGAVIKNEDGSPRINSFIFLNEEVMLHEDWNSMGMVATSSHSFEVKELRLPKNRCFAINEKQAVLDDPIYKYPFLQFAEATLAVNISGMGNRYLDLFEAITKKRATDAGFSKETIASLFIRLQDAKRLFQDARQLFYKVIQRSWDEHSKGFSAARLKEVSEVGRELAATTRRLVDELYPYGGLVMSNRDSEINRVWRNLHTASQHPLLLFPL